MYKVLIFAGTVEGRSVAEYLADNKVSVLACVATEYGAEVIEKKDNLHISSKRLNIEEMTELMKDEDCNLIIDATHPYAAMVSENIKKAADIAGKKLIRLVRESLYENVSDYSDNCVTVDSVKEAVNFLSSVKGNVLVTTGSKDLKEYTVINNFSERLYVRFLPAVNAVCDCLKLGYKQKNIICMQGPFSKEINVAMLKQTSSEWLVTKESGNAGGFLEKLEAAKEAGAKLVVISRPCAEKGASLEEVKDYLRKLFDIKDENILTDEKSDVGVCDSKISFKDDERQVTLIGIGMGNVSNMTIEAMKDCEEADLIMGASRMVDCCKHLNKPVFISYKDEELYNYFEEHKEYKKAVILLSGDIGFYSGAKKLITRFENKYKVLTRSGISSVVYFCGKLKTSWEDVKLMSLHGKSGNLIAAAAENQKVFSLVGGKEAVGEICSMLTEYGLGYVKVSVGKKLSYPDEEILQATAEELAGKPIGGLCVILIENPKAGILPVTHGIEDEEFIRAKVPMTKSEVRSISLSKLKLFKDSVIYDIGAGTGSVSIEMALQSYEGMVYAIEKKEEACNLIEENKRKFKAANIEVVRGLAPEALYDLPKPTHAFIGGSSGNMKEIMDLLLSKNPQIRIVINCIALESVAEALDCVKTLSVKDVDIIQINSSRSRELGRYHMMTGMNPIYIISCTGV